MAPNTEKIQYILELMKSRDLFIMPQQIIILNLNEGDFGGDSLPNYILRDLGWGHDNLPVYSDNNRK